MSTSKAIEVPEHLAASYSRGFGEEGRAWIAALPNLAAAFLDRWELRRDGAARAGEASLVLPVLRQDGTRAVLKLQMSREETTAALIGLRTWNGAGTVRLIDHDPHSSTMLLERLDSARTLASLEDDDVAMRILAELLARLVSVPAPGNCAASKTSPPTCWSGYRARSRPWPTRPAGSCCAAGRRPSPN